MPINTKLIITVLPETWDEERQDWSEFSLENLANAYSYDEPDYPLHRGQTSNQLTISP